MKLITERTEVALTSAKLPADTKSLKVPDSHTCFDKEQQDILKAYKDAFGVKSESTFKIAINKNDEQVIYSPSIVSKDSGLVIEWGGEYFPLPEDVKFSASSLLATVKVGKERYSLKVRVTPIEKDKAQTALQKKWAACPAAKKEELLSDAWDDGVIHELVAPALPDRVKLGAIIGTHDVIGFRMGGGKFAKYELQLADGRWVNANSSLNNKLGEYEAEGVEVSPSKPAQLTVSPSKSEHNGHPIYPTSLVSYRNLDLPVFDFGNLGGGDGEEVEDLTLDVDSRMDETESDLHSEPIPF